MSLTEYIRRREGRIFMGGFWGGFGFALLILLPPLVLYIVK